MKKLKTYAVTVAVTTEVMVFIEARSASRAEEKVQTPEGWGGAARYNEAAPGRFDSRTMRVAKVREC